MKACACGGDLLRHDIYLIARKAPSFRAGMNSADAEGVNLRTRRFGAVD